MFRHLFAMAVLTYPIVSSAELPHDASAVSCVHSRGTVFCHIARR